MPERPDMNERERLARERVARLQAALAARRAVEQPAAEESARSEAEADQATAAPEATEPARPAERRRRRREAEARPTVTEPEAGGTGDRELDRFLAVPIRDLRIELIKGWMLRNGGTATQRQWLTAQAALEAPATVAADTAEVARRVEIPRTERELRLFLRKEAIKALELHKGDGATAGDILDKIRLNLPGYSEEEKKAMVLFPPEIEGIDKIRKEILEELDARCELHNAQTREVNTYQGMKQSAAADQYVKDFDSGNAREISNKTFDWLKRVFDRGDGLSAGKIDEAFSVLVWAGEGEAPAGFEATLAPFREFIGVANAEGKVLNLYNGNYPTEAYDAFFDKLSAVYGSDAANLAWQMFQGLRLEGDYKPQHYLYGLTHPGENRDFLATALEVVVGSARILRDDEADHHSFKDEIERLVQLPLKARAKDEQAGNAKVDGLLMQRTNQGRFLRGTNFRARGMLSIERISVGAVKKGNAITSAWVEIGKLGDKTSDKAGKVDGAVAQLVAIASAFNDLLDLGAVEMAAVQKQLSIEAQNILWELSVRNEINMVPGQKKESVKFLLPSGINRMMDLISAATLEGVSRWPNEERFVVLSDGQLANISEYARHLRELAWKVFDALPTDDIEKTRNLITDERKASKFILPTVRGEQALPPEGAAVAAHRRRMERLADQISQAIRGANVRR